MGATLRLLSQNQCTDQLKVIPGAWRWLGSELPMGTETYRGIPEHQHFPGEQELRAHPGYLGDRTPVTLDVTSVSC